MSGAKFSHGFKRDALARVEEPGCPTSPSGRPRGLPVSCPSTLGSNPWRSFVSRIGLFSRCVFGPLSVMACNRQPGNPPTMITCSCDWREAVRPARAKHEYASA